MYLTELGGEFSSRLLLAGLLADLSVEHYNWVAGGDEQSRRQFGHDPLRRLYSSPARPLHGRNDIEDFR